MQHKDIGFLWAISQISTLRNAEVYSTETCKWQNNKDCPKAELGLGFQNSPHFQLVKSHIIQKNSGMPMVRSNTLAFIDGCNICNKMPLHKKHVILLFLQWIVLLDKPPDNFCSSIPAMVDIIQAKKFLLQQKSGCEIFL